MSLSLEQALTPEPGASKPATIMLGTVEAVAGRTVTVRDPGGTSLVLPKLRAYAAPVVGDVVLVLRAGAAGWVVDAFGPQPSQPVTPPPNPTPEPQLGASTFLPTDTGTWRGGWRGDTSSLYQGDWTGRGRNTGGAFYGGGPQGIAGATPTSAVLTVQRLAGGPGAAAAPTLQLLGAKTAAAPTMLASQVGPAIPVGATADIAVPTAWATALINGSAQGIGIYVAADAPYIQLAGRDTYPAAFALRIEWRR